MKKRGGKAQFGLEFILVHAWAIFLALIALSLLSYLFFSYKAVYSIFPFKQQAGISGNLIYSTGSLQISSSTIVQNTNLIVTINPGSN